MTRIGGKSLSELSDQELQAELERRREARGFSPDAGAHRGNRSAHRARRTATGKPSTGKPSTSKPLPGWKQRENVRKWLRALELDEGAGLDDVEASYRRLLERYDPDRHRDDPTRFRDATKLAVALGEAYYGLRDHFEASE